MGAVSELVSFVCDEGWPAFGKHTVRYNSMLRPTATVAGYF